MNQNKNWLRRRGWLSKLVIQSGLPFYLMIKTDALDEYGVLVCILPMMFVGYLWAKFLDSKWGDELFGLNSHISEQIILHTDVDSLEEDLKNEAA